MLRKKYFKIELIELNEKMMSKTKEELDQIRKDYESLLKKLSTLTNKELIEVTDGIRDIAFKTKEKYKNLCED